MDGGHTQRSWENGPTKIADREKGKQKKGASNGGMGTVHKKRASTTRGGVEVNND